MWDSLAVFSQRMVTTEGIGITITAMSVGDVVIKIYEVFVTFELYEKTY